MTGRHRTSVNSWDFSTMANLPLDSCTIPVKVPATVSPSAAARKRFVLSCASAAPLRATSRPQFEGHIVLDRTSRAAAIAHFEHEDAHTYQRSKGLWADIRHSGRAALVQMSFFGRL